MFIAERDPELHAGNSKNVTCWLGKMDMGLMQCSNHLDDGGKTFSIAEILSSRTLSGRANSPGPMRSGARVLMFDSGNVRLRSCGVEDQLPSILLLSDRSMVTSDTFAGRREAISDDTGKKDELSCARGACPAARNARISREHRQKHT